MCAAGVGPTIDRADGGGWPLQANLAAMFNTLQLPELSFPTLIAPCNAECKANHEAMFGGGAGGGGGGGATLPTVPIHAIGGGGHRRLQQQQQQADDGRVGVKVQVSVSGVNEVDLDMLQARLQRELVSSMSGHRGRRLTATVPGDGGACSSEMEMWRRKAEGLEAQLAALRSAV